VASLGSVRYTPQVLDPSNGYEAAAARFMACRSRIGADEVRVWAESLPRHARVLDIGCGHGVPITEVLLAAGCRVHALDAAPSLVAAFRERFPDVPVVCEAADTSPFFHLTFDAIVAWGLVFLLEPAAQRRLLANVSRALTADGTFLFTAPAEPCAWTDVLTGQPSISLGAAAYRDTLGRVGLIIQNEFDDDGGNHYYVVRRR
jgi:SAM-dependent methyltransferase